MSQERALEALRALDPRERERVFQEVRLWHFTLVTQGATEAGQSYEDTRTYDGFGHLKHAWRELGQQGDEGRRSMASG